mmetsp:Transcript_1912/g.4705  ORF Transcript_1912/g.4705 Transcript_1912/m.4705 type:complete len:251 (-) Transcript_1912:124-876(-)
MPFEDLRGGVPQEAEHRLVLRGLQPLQAAVLLAMRLADRPQLSFGQRLILWLEYPLRLREGVPHAIDAVIALQYVGRKRLVDADDITGLASDQFVRQVRGGVADVIAALAFVTTTPIGHHRYEALQEGVNLTDGTFRQVDLVLRFGIGQAAAAREQQLRQRRHMVSVRVGDEDVLLLLRVGRHEVGLHEGAAVQHPPQLRHDERRPIIGPAPSDDVEQRGRAGGLGRVRQLQRGRERLLHHRANDRLPRK